MERRSLPSLGAGEVGVVSAIAEGRFAAKRLADMGCVRGARLRMIRPGLPCIVQIEGVCLGLGAGHQESIEITPL